MAFGDIDIEIVGVTFTEPAGDEDTDEPAVNLGDTTDGAGMAAGSPMMAPMGFFGSPDLPSANGAGAKAVVLTIGNARVVIAGTDNRPLSSLVAALGPGDRAILSSCPARFELRRAGNKVGLYADNAKVEINGAAGQVEAAKDDCKVLLTAAGGTMTWDAGAGTSASATVAPTQTLLSYTAAGVTCTIKLGPGGRVDITAPGGVFVNNIPLTVP